MHTPRPYRTCLSFLYYITYHNIRGLTRKKNNAVISGRILRNFRKVVVSIVGKTIGAVKDQLVTRILPTKLGRQDHSQVGRRCFEAEEQWTSQEKEEEKMIEMRVRGEAGLEHGGQPLCVLLVSASGHEPPHPKCQQVVGATSMLTPLGCGLRLSRWLVN